MTNTLSMLFPFPYQRYPCMLSLLIETTWKRPDIHHPYVHVNSKLWHYCSLEPLYFISSLIMEWKKIFILC